MFFFLFTVSLKLFWQRYSGLKGFSDIYNKLFASISTTPTTAYKIKSQIRDILNNILTLDGVSSSWVIVKGDDGVYRYEVLVGSCRETSGFKDAESYFGVERIIAGEYFITEKRFIKDISSYNLSLVFTMCEGDFINGFVGFSGKYDVLRSRYGIENLKTIASIIMWMYKNAYKIRDLELQAKKNIIQADSAVEELSATNIRLIESVKELRSLYNLSVAVYASSSTQKAAEAVFREIRNIIGISGYAYFEVFGDRLRFKCSSSGILNEKLKNVELPIEILPDNRVVEIDYVSADIKMKEIFDSFKSSSLIVLPARVASTVQGVFLLKGDNKRGYSSRDFELLEMYANRLAEFTQRNETLASLFSSNRRLNELNKVKDNFIALMSHELKTPLTSIKGFTEALLSGQCGELNKKQQNFLKIIMESGEKLGASIDNIIETNRLTRGLREFKKEKHNLQKIIKEVINEFKESFENKNINCTIQIENNFPEVYLDREKIKRALEALFENAVKFNSPNGTVHVEMTRRGDFAQVAVIDSGIGVSEKLREKVFEKFFQVQETKTRSFGGMGLGLTIARSIVSNHGGDINIESSTGGGARVSFILPLK